MTLPREAVLARRFTVWMLAVTAAFLPLYVVRWHYGPLPTSLLETSILITVAGYAATLWTEKRLPAARTPYDIPIVLLLVAGAIGTVVALDHVHAAGSYRAYFLEAIAIFYIGVDILRTREDLRPLLLAAAVMASIYAVGQVVDFVWVTAHHHLQIGDAPSFLNLSPNADAMFLEMPLAFAAAFVLFPSRPRERVVAAVVLALVLLAMILTLSRAGYLAMAILAVVLVLNAQSRRLRIWMVGALALVAVVVLEVPFINQRVFTLASSAALRTSIYGQALRMLSQRPIFGAGIDGFAQAVAPFRPGNQTIELYPHDFWLTTWSEIGLLGLVAFAIIYFGVLWRAARALPAANDIWRPVLWGCVGAMVLWLVHGLFDSPYWKNDLSVEFWLVAALSVVAARAVRSAGSGDGPAGP
ncbi:MAG TPA: O-antigen ligase family protein [Candidatus Acidoferrum sp.]|nr:O-antigen ligase family protein [Candidatus Acidoferrum sp.]